MVEKIRQQIGGRLVRVEICFFPIRLFYGNTHVSVLRLQVVAILFKRLHFVGDFRCNKHRGFSGLPVGPLVNLRL